jgi:hypothetical protein
VKLSKTEKRVLRIVAERLAQQTANLLKWADEGCVDHPTLYASSQVIELSLSDVRELLFPEAT